HAPLQPVEKLAAVAQLLSRIHGVLVDAGHRALQGHIEQVTVDDGVPVRGLQEPRLDGLENVLAKARVSDMEVLQRHDVQLIPRLGLGWEVGLVEEHYCPTSPSCLFRSTAKAWRSRPGIGTPTSPKFSTTDSAS